VSCFVRQKLKEFTGHGQALRVVSLHPDISYPWYALESVVGRALVCHGGVGADGRRLVAVGMDGRGTAVYGLRDGGGTTSGAGGGALCGGGMTNSPMHAAVDADNFVVVLDCDNRALTLLDPELVFVRDLVSAGDATALGLKDPRRICLDANNSQIYVGDGNGSVTVIQFQ